MVWEYAKCSIRTETLEYCKEKAKLEKHRERVLEKQIDEYEKKLIEEGSEHYNTYLALKSEWENVQKVKTNGIILRSKAKWVENGEKNTKYFLNLEKRNYNIKYIKCLVTHENKTINDPNEILKAQFDFYKALYTSKQTKGNQTENFINEN